MKFAVSALVLLVAHASAFVDPCPSQRLSSGTFLFGTKVEDPRTPNPLIAGMGTAMGLLSPVFKAEAALQAAVLKGSVDEDDVRQEVNAEIKTNKALIYTYGLSPFSTEAVEILKATGYQFTEKELGAEWFLLGGKESLQRVILSEFDDGKTSLPKIFINGNCVGGCAELSALTNSNELELLLSQERVAKAGGAKKKGLFSF